MRDTKDKTPNPRFKKLCFYTLTEFEAWLAQKAVYEIEFADQGQDLLKIWADERGEILHTNAQPEIWNGKMIYTGHLKKGAPLLCWLEGEYKAYWRLIINKVTLLKEQK